MTKRRNLSPAAQAELEDYISSISRPSLDQDGREVLDTTPVAPPVGYRRQPSMVENIRAMIRSEKLRQEAAEAGYETFEEADDFDVGDDYDPTSPYEGDFEPLPPPEPPSAGPASQPAPPADPPSDGPVTPAARTDGQQS